MNKKIIAIIGAIIIAILILLLAVFVLKGKNTEPENDLNMPNNTQNDAPTKQIDIASNKDEDQLVKDIKDNMPEGTTDEVVKITLDNELTDSQKDTIDNNYILDKPKDDSLVVDPETGVVTYEGQNGDTVIDESIAEIKDVTEEDLQEFLKQSRQQTEDIASGKRDVSLGIDATIPSVDENGNKTNEKDEESSPEDTYDASQNSGQLSGEAALKAIIEKNGLVGSDLGRNLTPEEIAAMSESLQLEN